MLDPLLMANIRKETGRHDWQEQILKRGNERVEGVLCLNCRAFRYDRNGDLPVTGCLSEVKISNCGDSRLADYSEQESRRRTELDRLERERDLADIAMVRQSRPSSDFERHLERQLERELS